MGKHLGSLACAAATLAAFATRLAAAEPSDLDALLATRVDAASKLEATTLRAPASVAIVTAEDIERFGYRTLGEALASAAGLYLSNDRNYAYLGVRGISRPSDYNNRVAILVDGVRLNDDVYAYAAIGGDLPLDMHAVDRIEIVRGPGSATFGTAAMLAVVNVVLKKPTSLAGVHVAVEAGDFGRTAAAARGVLGSRDAPWLAWSVTASENDGPSLHYAEYADEPGGGRTADTDWERARGVTLRGSLGALDFTGFATRRDKGVPTGSFETVFDDRRNATADSWSVLAARWRAPLRQDIDVTLRGEVGKYAYDGTSVYELVTRDSTDNDWWTGEIEATWTPRADQRLAAGLEYRDNYRADYRVFADDGTVDFDGDFPYRIQAGYVEYELQATEELLLSVGLRRDEYSTGPSSTNPRLAVVYQPDDRSAFKLLYGSAFRAPNVYELHYENVDAIGNPDLAPETQRALELVAQRRLGGSWLASASLFHNRLDRLIEQRPVDDDPRLQFTNVGRATSRGVELGLTYRDPAGWHAAFDGTYQRAVDLQTDEELTNSPELLLRAALATPPLHRLSGAVEALYGAGRRTLAGISTDAATVVNGTLAWSPREHLAVQLQARNLFDARYAYPGGPEHRQAAIEQDGRTLTLRLEVAFP